MSENKDWQKLLTSPWIIGLFIFLIFIVTNGYKYGWDDQHLEIPMLKSLIDPTYYQGDYYVETLKKNFPSFFYRVLSKIIGVGQIPATYLLLYLVSRYFMFFWMYKLWYYISKNRFAAIGAVLTFILVVRVDEFLYRTFSHQEFVLPFIFAGFYYFYKERFLLASFLFGFGANIHGIYSLFPMMFMMTYLLWQVREHKFLTLIKSGLIFVISALPFIIFIVHNRLSHAQALTVDNSVDWLSLFITACPQNFLFPQAPMIPFAKLTENWNIFYALTQSYIFILLMFFVNLFVNEQFRKDKKILSICLMGFILLVIWGIFTYVHPDRFVLDLNLVRNLQFLTLFLTSYLVIFMVQQIERQPILVGFVFGLVFTFLKFYYSAAGFGLIIMICVYLIAEELKKEKSVNRALFLTMATILAGYAGWQIKDYFAHTEIRLLLWINLLVIFSLLTVNYFSLIVSKKSPSIFRKYLFLIIPLAVFTFQYANFHIQKLKMEQTEGGFWQLQRNWEEMQRYVQKNTPKNAIIFTPYNMEMGGFRIFSERRVVVCYRDIGLIGFDYSAAVEWARRIHDVEAFQVNVAKPIMSAIQNAIVKYNANYIVFMRYAKPVRDTGLLTHIYTNESFSLYRVNR